MYLELFLPLALGSVGGIVYKKWIEHRKQEYDPSYDDFDFLDDEMDSCPTIMFDKNGNMYYIYD